MPKSIKGIKDITPDKANANKGTQRGRGMVESSLRRYGAGQSILVDKDGNVIAGNKTIEAAQEIGLPVKVVQTDATLACRGPEDRSGPLDRRGRPPACLRGQSRRGGRDRVGRRAGGLRPGGWRY